MKTIRVLAWVAFCVCLAISAFGQAPDAGNNSAAQSGRPVSLERSFWIHASLGSDTRLNYWGTNFAAPQIPTKAQVRNAVRLLTGSYAVNRLYLIYHREVPAKKARQIFAWWRKYCPREVELVPTLVLSMYDKAQTPVFTTNELAEWAQFFRAKISSKRLAIYDVYPREQIPAAIQLLAREYPAGLIRVGLQPGELLNAPFIAGVEDTWSGLCHGADNERDWRQPGFGAETLRNWVLARNAETRPIAWDLVVVAWDYKATDRGGHPGYDDLRRNMPLPTGRNRAAAQLIREVAKPKQLAGFSSDLFILQVNSHPAVHDGATNAFYECLKRGEDYRGYYAQPFQEVVAIYRELRDQER